MNLFFSTKVANEEMRWLIFPVLMLQACKLGERKKPIGIQLSWRMHCIEKIKVGHLSGRMILYILTTTYLYIYQLHWSWEINLKIWNSVLKNEKLLMILQCQTLVAGLFTRKKLETEWVANAAVKRLSL